MNSPTVKVDRIEVNIKAPGELHVVSPHSAHKSRHQGQNKIPQSIQEQLSGKQSQQPISAHKIKHIKSLQDKGQFVDEKQHKRVSDKDEAVETINRIIHPQQQLSMEQAQLQKIAEEGANQCPNSKPLKHIKMEEIYDKDEFNLRNSREKEVSKKRRLSETNIEGYLQENVHFPVVTYLTELQRSIPEKVIQEENIIEKKQFVEESPMKRHRRSSFHSAHHGNGVSEQIQRMIVDEIDKKKKIKSEQQQQQEKQQSQMQAIKEQKQEEDLVNTANLQQARQRIQGQIEALSKVVGKQVGPQQTRHLYIQKEQSINQDCKQDRDE